ncbi:MAG TPA: GH116 family glycosyl hydrolase, partial [Phycisphaerae bacterium]|nr:GH116 family glycosyl hydrolase [Phycisphaerae bacterium]
TTTAKAGVTCRTGWIQGGWNLGLKDFWADFSADGKLDDRRQQGADVPMASLAVGVKIPAKGTREITFLLTWHFPNRRTWTPEKDKAPEIVGNYYTTRYQDAWDVACKVAPQLAELEARTVEFVGAFCEADLPEAVKEAALFNVTNLRTQTCFRTADGLFFGFEGYGDHDGCCHGTCTHVWNYEQATAFLFGELAKMMREVEFAHATDETGLMSFRVNLPLSRARGFHKGAADGQMGCIMKMYRDWQLSGDDEMLRKLWPNVKKALAFCWIEGGWDGDRDGVMEGCQHNTMDVEYYGPNPQMEGWYLGALRAGEEMARYLGDDDFAATCRDLFERGRKWTDQHLFNSEYYEHEIRAPADVAKVPEGIRLGMHAREGKIPAYQLGPGCLVDQLVGQYMAHVCGLGYLLDPAHIRRTLKSILKYNRRSPMRGHFNYMRTFALGEETALLMASYPKDEIESPFPYYTEVMTGFEYAAAVGMIQEGQAADGLRCIKDIRDRYDGRKRSPFNEAECGHHYARAMASWAAVTALTGFAYSGVARSMAFAPKAGTFFWSNGHAWGTCRIKKAGRAMQVELSVLHGELELSSFELRGYGCHKWDAPARIAAGGKARFLVQPG